VRDCRPSVEHDLNQIRVLASPAAERPYLDQTPFPVGAVLLKAEFADPECATDFVRFSAMRKEAAGFSPAAGDWYWQRILADGTVTNDGRDSTCINCHTRCDPSWFDTTCTVP
jgi:hypothetical protein